MDDALQRLQGAHDEWKKRALTAEKHCLFLSDKLEQAQAERDRMREALAVFGNQENWDAGYMDGDENIPRAVWIPIPGAPEYPIEYARRALGNEQP